MSGWTATAERQPTRLRAWTGLRPGASPLTFLGSQDCSRCHDGNLGMGIRYLLISDLTCMSMRMTFYPWVTSVSDLNRDGYDADIFFHPQVTQWVPDTLPPL
jgi:hypothetical protein